MIKETFTLILTYEMSINPDTGEILETKLINRSVDKPKKNKIENLKKEEVKADTNEEPKLYLNDNNCVLNDSAISFMNISPGDKVDIKYKDGSSGPIPIIGTDESFGTKGGTKFNKSRSFSYRGTKNEQLAKYGIEFTLEKYPTKEGLFILVSKENNSKLKIEDENVALPELNLDDLIDNTDSEVTEIDPSLFQF